MTQEIHKRVLKYFIKEDLFLVILNSFSQGKIVSFLQRFGIDFPGTRMSSIPKEELAIALTEESYHHPEIMEELIVFLNKTNKDEIERIRMTPVQEIKRYIGSIERLSLNDKVGSVFWALVCDERRDVNELIKGFKQEVVRFAKKLHRMEEVTYEETKEKTGLEAILEKDIKDYVRHLEEDARDNIKVLERLREENKRLSDEINKMQERIRELQKINGQLINDKGILRKENERFQRHIGDLKSEVIQLKEKLQTAPKARLASEVHQLERENKKIMYELEKERRQTRDQLQRYASENKELRERLNELQIMTYRLEEELGIERQHVAEIGQKTQIQDVNPFPEAPLHKGRRLGIFVDGQNVYYSARLHYGKRIDYKKLISILIRDRHLVKAVCYIIEQPDIDQGKFINMLRYSGYTVKTRSLIKRADGSLKANWDVGIAADVINEVDKNNLDIVVLVTCDGDFVDLAKLLKPKGIKVEIAGFPYNTAMELKNVSDEFYSIEEDLMLTAV